MHNYTLQTNRTDALQSLISSGATTATLVGGNFGSPAGRQMLVIDYDIPNLLEVVRCNIVGSTLTAMERGLDGTTAREHLPNAKIMMAFVPEASPASTMFT